MELFDTKNLIENSKENRELLEANDKCDKFDYLISVACGAIGGIVDIFMVGAPGSSILGNWTDDMADKVVKSFASKIGWNPKESQKENVASAIGFLEKKFKINYDQRYSSDVGNQFRMSSKDHHMMSLSHAPDIVGLFFSVLNQFTSTSSFIANGQLVSIDTDTFELKGGNFIAKLFCGVANWFGHLISDIAGSSGKMERGSGIVAPFYELFQLCKFGKFSVGKDKQDLAMIALRSFEEGYDFRFAVATAIPVAITNLSIRLLWALRQHFQYKRPIKDCIPSSKHSNLRVMLLVGNGVLCVMDAIDAGVRSGGNFLLFFTRLNLLAWFKFAMLVLKEVCIRIGLNDKVQEFIDALKRINEALLVYMKDLESIDIEGFKRETEEYNQIVKIFTTPTSDKELNAMLLNTFEILGINKPWNEDFDNHMSNKNATLVFE